MLDLRLERLAQRAVANDVANKIDSAAREFGASVDELVETLECNLPANAHDPWDASTIAGAGLLKTFEIYSVVNPVNFRRGIGTALTEQVATVIGLGCDEFRCGADLA